MVSFLKAYVLSCAERREFVTEQRTNHQPNRRFFDKALKDPSMKIEDQGKAKKFLEAMKEFQNCQDLLFRLVNKKACPVIARICQSLSKEV
jgi:hypothetical protein